MINNEIFDQIAKTIPRIKIGIDIQRRVIKEIKKLKCQKLSKFREIEINKEGIKIKKMIIPII
jgi:hypothetical protein